MKFLNSFENLKKKNSTRSDRNLQNHGTECVESFYQQLVEEEMKGLKVSEEEKKQMEEMLKKQREQAEEEEDGIHFHRSSLCISLAHNGSHLFQ